MSIRLSSPEHLTFGFTAATRLIVGPGSLRQLGEIARDIGATRVLVTSDRGIIE